MPDDLKEFDEETRKAVTEFRFFLQACCYIRNYGLDPHNPIVC